MQTTEIAANIDVVAAVLKNDNDEILLTKRPPGKDYAGYWEFPGGKLEPGETIESALRRELDEELGIRLDSFEPLIKVNYHYPEKHVRLDVYQLNHWQGAPQGREGQEIQWAKLNDIKHFQMLPADKPVINALRLPRFYGITVPDFNSQKSCLNHIENLLQQGISLIQLRLPGLDKNTYADVARQALTLSQDYRAHLMLKDVELANQLKTGLHLSSRDLMACTGRPVDSDQWFAASCHNTEESEQAERLGCDFICLSPVCDTASHPGRSVLGWEGFAEHVRQINVPVYALGGVGRNDLKLAIQSGAQGIAGISDFI